MSFNYQKHNKSWIRITWHDLKVLINWLSFLVLQDPISTPKSTSMCQQKVNKFVTSMIWVSITKNTINLGSESLGMISRFWSIGWASWCCRIPSQPQKALVCANKKLMWNQAEALCKEVNALSIPWWLQYIVLQAGLNKGCSFNTR